MEHLDHLGDDGQFLRRHFEPQVKGLDELCSHFFSWSGGDIRVGLKQSLHKTRRSKSGSELGGNNTCACLATYEIVNNSVLPSLHGWWGILLGQPLVVE